MGRRGRESSRLDGPDMAYLGRACAGSRLTQDAPYYQEVDLWVRIRAGSHGDLQESAPASSDPEAAPKYPTSVCPSLP